MNSSVRKRDYSKVGSSTRIQKQNADPIWNVQNEMLQSQAEANGRLRQQITKQSYADSAIQINIKDKISLLKEKAVQLAQGLQSEKRKNIQLEAIIRHMVYIRQEEKKVEATHRDDMNFENIDNLFRKIKKLEYDLEQMFSKLNDLQSRNKQKKNEVDTYRTQRVIDSGIFLKIEKEIVQYQIQYKKLLIEKTKFQRSYNKNLQNYKKMKADIEKQQHINLSKRSITVQKQQTQENQENFFVNAPEIQHALKFTQINSTTDQKGKNFFGSKILLTFDSKKENQYHDMQYTVKKLFLQTGVNDPQTLKDLLQNIEQVNNSLFEEVNSDTDKISELKKSLNDLRLKKQEKTVKYYEKQPEMTKNQIKLKQSLAIEGEIKKTQACSEKATKMLQYFLKTSQIRQIGQIISLNDISSYNLDSLETLFVDLEDKLNPLFTKLDEGKKKQVDQTKTYFEGVKQSEGKEQSIQQLINKVKKVEQSQKIMGKQDFKRQYQQIRKNQSSGKGRLGKRKTTTILKKH